ncbi:hypothetical protein [Acetobacterium woodii]|uniref:Uncharacterized protein n=1 Tax=Acetobacterium woodii (strain ATCC 29683 / DSM 1030 / JCM 2381 / KCTC 1655 / WB1) TaxID=931626 RepID=H6LD86_ACEWD|nr:hypothetical protein [Acetobacterium woodii]AFA49131.1 hypothetical protein Awo_c23580 [Acetobacterium woodii DSM 1030]
MDELNKLSDVELKNKLADLKEDLEDVENERSFIFKQSGVHVSSSKVSIQMEEYDTDIENLTASIAKCEKEIKRRNI